MISDTQDTRRKFIMEKREQLYEGKAKKVFATDDPEKLIVSYKDDATAFNGEKKGSTITTYQNSTGLHLNGAMPTVTISSIFPHRSLTATS